MRWLRPSMLPCQRCAHLRRHYADRILREYLGEGGAAWRRACGYDAAPHLEARDWARFRALVRPPRLADAVGTVAKAVVE